MEHFKRDIGTLLRSLSFTLTRDGERKLQSLPNILTLKTHGFNRTEQPSTLSECRWQQSDGCAVTALSLRTLSLIGHPDSPRPIRIEKFFFMITSKAYRQQFYSKCPKIVHDLNTAGSSKNSIKFHPVVCDM